MKKRERSCTYLQIIHPEKAVERISQNIMVTTQNNEIKCSNNIWYLNTAYCNNHLNIQKW